MTIAQARVFSRVAGPARRRKIRCDVLPAAEEWRDMIHRPGRPRWHDPPAIGADKRRGGDQFTAPSVSRVQSGLFYPGPTLPFSFVPSSACSYPVFSPPLWVLLPPSGDQNSAFHRSFAGFRYPFGSIHPGVALQGEVDLSERR